jgi:hypothetical protein
MRSSRSGYILHLQGRFRRQLSRRGVGTRHHISASGSVDFFRVAVEVSGYEVQAIGFTEDLGDVLDCALLGGLGSR